MQCQQCKKELPEDARYNRRYCDECLAQRKKESRHKYYVAVEKGNMAAKRASVPETVSQIRTPEDGYILLAETILKGFTNEYEAVLQQYRDDPSRKHELRLQEYEDRLRCEFEYYSILSLQELDDVESFIRSWRLKVRV